VLDAAASVDVEALSASDVDGADVEVSVVCAPPLLLTVTPGATTDVEDVAPDEVLSEDVASLTVTVDVEVVDDADGAAADDVAVEPEPLAVAASLVVPGFGAPVFESAPADESPDDVDDEVDVSALAKPGDVTTSTPIPRAAASAPTRPM
jgi:hypothetical protein